jgi:23S rRNA pseudoU1915 N3-methylase RlmH
MSGGNTTTQVIEQNIPEEFMPYYMDLLDRGVSESLKPYTPYEGQRLAGVNADMQSSYDLTRQIAGAGSPMMDAAMGTASRNAQTAAGMAGGQQPYQFSQFDDFSGYNYSPYAGYGESEFTAYEGYDPFSYSGYNYTDPRMFDTEAASQYMDPFLNQVLTEQQKEMEKSFARNQSRSTASAVSAGAFGGSRGAVESAIAQDELLDRQAAQEAALRQQAYYAAMDQFNADRAAEMGVDVLRGQDVARVQGGTAAERARVQGAQGADLARIEAARADEAARVQSGIASELARVQGGTAAEQARVQQAQAAEAARVQSSQAAENRNATMTKLELLGFSSEQARMAADLEVAARNGDMQAAAMLESIGLSQQVRDQMALDLQYEDYLRQEGYTQEQINELANLILGLPVAPATTQTTSQPTNAAAQGLGAATTLTALIKAMQGG